MKVLLTGLLPFVILSASVLALPVSLFLLRLYRRAVERGMRQIAAGAQNQPPAAPHASPSSTLAVSLVDRDAVPDVASPAYREARRGPWRAVAVYAGAGFVYAAIMAAAWLTATRDDAIVWTKVALLVCTYWWPAVLAATVVAGDDRTMRLKIFTTYFGVLAAMFIVIAVRNPQMGAGELPLYWIIENGPATVLVMVFLLRSIRAVGPMVLAFLLMVSAGSQALVEAASTNERLLRKISDAGFSLGLSATVVFAAMIASGMLLFGALGWPLISVIGRRYRRKKLSDQSLTIDAVWLVFGVVGSIGLAFEGAAWIFSGVVAFAAFKLASIAGFRLTNGGARRAAPTTLLLLRVFSLGKRSERLFDSLRKHWLYAGPVVMIAGPDLVTTTVEPHEFLAFVSGQLGRQFVASGDDLERRIAALDVARDPDGRFRVNEFFCRSDTWQPTMQRLAASSDVVLMDLRSFTRANRGCVYEIERLLDDVDLRRIVFLVDGTTDQPFLRETLQTAWRGVAVGSPNASQPSADARLFSIGAHGHREIDALLRLLAASKASATVAATHA